MTARDHYLIEEIRAALATDERAAELGITVDIVDGDVYLRGVVATQERKDAVEQVASECCPGMRVHNETEVEEIGQPTAMEQLS